MPWQKGQSGNPKGRAAEQETVRRLGKQHTPEAFEKILSLMRRSTDDRVQLAAAQEIINRGYGKPSQPIIADDAPPAESPRALDDDELIAVVVAARKRTQAPELQPPDETTH